MKSIFILIGFICVVDKETQLPQCSLIQEFYDSAEHCIAKSNDTVEFLKELDIKHYHISCKPWHFQELQNSKL